jgi:hypothetical protein
VKRAILLVFTLTILGGLMTTEAQADILKPNPDTLAIQGILAKYKSPLPWWTISAFHTAHPDFDLSGYFTVMSAESSLGTTGGSHTYNNPGNLRPAKGSTKIWQTLATGQWFCPGQGWYNVYPDMYTGQRAAIRLIYDSDHHYNALLAAHKWEAMASIYYGAGVAGLAGYIKSLKAVHARIVKEAAKYGASW